MEVLRLVSVALTSSLILACGSHPGSDDDGTVDGGGSAALVKL